MSAVFRAIPGITADRAVQLATRFADNKHWRLGFLSNTGVTCSVLSEELEHLQDAFMLRDGSAGQWIVEFFRRTPYAITVNDSDRSFHCIRSVIATAHGVTTLPDSGFVYSGIVRPLELKWVRGLDAAFQFTLRRMHRPFDGASVTSRVASGGKCSWNFSFYLCKRRSAHTIPGLVARASVSMDGRDVVIC